MPPTQERDEVLGNFMDCWSRLEFMTFMNFWILTGTSRQVAQTIFATGFQTRNLRELLIALGSFRLVEEENKSLEALCERFGRVATKRNRIIHGKWACETEILETEIKSIWARYYAPIDPAMNPNPWGADQKSRDAYRFTVSQIKQISEHIDTLITDFSQLNSGVCIRLYGQPMPRE